MSELWQTVVAFFTGERVVMVVRAGMTLAVGLLMARLASRVVARALAARAEAQLTMILRRVTFWGLLGTAVFSALGVLGVDLSVLLGAAGILTVALGFASQTSASNLISGLFLMGERPFVVGDIIRVGETTGEVISIDMISVKLRTFDNLLVRVPNENLLKSEITNLTHFPIRRVDIMVGVAYKEDLARVEKLLVEVADRNPLCLDEPRPLVLFRGYGDSSIDLQFSVWAARETFLAVKTGLHRQVKEAFDHHGVEIPFPHRSHYAGSVTEPFPVRLVAVPSPGGGPDGDNS